MSTSEPNLKRTTVDLGQLCNMVTARISRMSKAETERLSKKIISYVLRDALDGGPINNRVMREVFHTINDIVGGGIVLPKDLEEEKEEG